jgi:hypothetical protein
LPGQVPHDCPHVGSGPHCSAPQLGVHPQTPVVPPPPHVCGAVHDPHEPLHPSDPQFLPAQLGVQHWPLLRQVWPLKHVPHDVPHAGSGPHARPVQLGVQLQIPFGLQVPASHVPHEWPQPSVPHCLPLHVHATQVLFWQV